MFQINLFSLSFLNFEDSQTKIPNYFSNQSQQNSTYCCSISKIYKKMKMTYQGLREAAASEISDFCSSAALSVLLFFLHPSPKRKKRCCPRSPFFAKKKLSFPLLLPFFFSCCPLFSFSRFFPP